MSVVDREVVRRILDFEKIKDQNQVFLEIFKEIELLEKDQNLIIEMNWPSLFEILGLRKIFEQLPKFEQSKRFKEVIASLISSANNEEWIYLYDQIFVDCLTNIKNLPQLNPDFFIDQIQKIKQSHLSSLLSVPLEKYEKRFIQEPAKTMHDLILYLAWDRVCVNLAILFEYNFQGIDVSKGLKVFKECLLESFQHITDQGKSRPGFFRLLEALYALAMREEQLNAHTEWEWKILCQSSKILTPREEIVDACYIDAIVVKKDLFQTKDSYLKIATLDSVEKVNIALKLTKYMLDKLTNEEKDWKYTLRSFEIICLKEFDQGFIIEEIIKD